MQNEENDYSFKDLFVPPTAKKSIIFIIIIGFFVYFNMLFNGFVWDDNIYIFSNQLVQNFNIPQLFGPNMFNTLGLYRPIPAIYFTILFQVFGNSAFFYHLIQVAIHLLNGILLYLFFKKFFREKLSLFFSLVFLVHPMNVESVSFISSTVSPLFFLFGITALLQIQKEKVNILSVVSQFFFSVLSMLTKETGVLFIPLIIFYGFLFRKKQLLLLSFSSIFAVGVYLFIRLFVGGVYLVSNTSIPIAKLSFFERMISVPAIIFYYIKTFLFPILLSIDQLWVITKPTFLNFYLPLVIDTIFIGSLVILGWYLLRKDKKQFDIFAFFCVWFLLGLFLLLQLHPLDMTVADRWFYFPSVGLLGILGVCWQEVQTKIVKFKSLVIICAIIILVLLSFRTILRNNDWQSDMSLDSRDIQIEDNYDIENNLGSSYFVAKQYDMAQIHFEKSIKMNPAQAIGWSNLGWVYAQKGNRKLAEAYLRKAIANDPKFQIAYSNLVVLLYSYKDDKQARETLNLAIKKFPNNASLIGLLAITEYQLGDRNEALATAKKANSLFATDRNKYIYNQILNNQPIDFR